MISKKKPHEYLDRELRAIYGGECEIRKCAQCGKDCSLKYCLISLDYFTLSRAYGLRDNNHFCSEKCMTKYMTRCIPRALWVDLEEVAITLVWEIN